jgi:hypothetical protein
MQARIAALETKWETVVPTLATKGDVQAGFADMRSELHKMDASLKAWMLATVLGLFLGFGGLFLAMSNALKPSPVAAQSQTAAPQAQAPAATPSKP